MQCTNEECTKEATTVRPSQGHMSGSPASQKLCDGCGEKYDKKIAERQQAYRDQRKKDLDTKHNQVFQKG